MLKLIFNAFIPPPYKRSVFHFGRANKDLMQQACRMYDWEGEMALRNNDPELQVEHFNEVINNISKNFIPHEEKTFHPGDPPWLTKNCKNSYKKYNRCYKRFARRGFLPAEKERVNTLKSEYTNMVTKKYWTALKS